MLSYAITFAALAASAAAINPFNPIFPGSPVRAVMPRQTDSPGGDDSPGGPFGGGFDECAKSFFGLIGTFPMPPRDIMKWMMNYSMTATGAFPAMPTDGCPPFIKDLPGSLASEWISHQSATLSWYSGHSTDFSSALSACPANATASFPSIGPCTVTPTAIAGGSGSDDNSDDNDSSSASGSKSGSGSVSKPSAAPSAAAGSGSLVSYIA